MSRYYPQFERLTGGYRQLLEFYVGHGSRRRTVWRALPNAGYTGRMPPTKTAGPFAALIEDPDRKVVLLTSDEAAKPNRE